MSELVWLCSGEGRPPHRPSGQSRSLASRGPGHLAEGEGAAISEPGPVGSADPELPSLSHTFAFIQIPAPKDQAAP